MGGDETGGLQRVTALGRTIDVRYPTNRAIVLLSAGTTVAVAVVQGALGGAWAGALARGVNAGLAVFLTWAMARELDPDHDLSAFAAAALMIVGVAVWGETELLPTLWALVLARVLGRTSGVAARPLDTLAIVGLSGWLTYTSNWNFGLVAALALFLDSRLPAPVRHHLPVALVLAAGTTAWSLRGGGSEGARDLGFLGTLVLAAAAGLFLPVIVGSGGVRAVGDQTGERLEPRRVQSAQAVALLAGVQLALWDGWLGVQDMMALWAAMVGVGVYTFVASVRRAMGVGRGGGRAPLGG